MHIFKEICKEPLDERKFHPNAEHSPFVKANKQKTIYFTNILGSVVQRRNSMSCK